jgi:hypothetical protein
LCSVVLDICHNSLLKEATGTPTFFVFVILLRITYSKLSGIEYLKNKSIKINSDYSYVGQDNELGMMDDEAKLETA